MHAAAPQHPLNSKVRSQARWLLGGWFCLLSAFGCDPPVDHDSVRTVTSPPTYVGSGACRDCHADQHAQWADSHHAQAMMQPTAENVVGNFAEATFEHDDTTATFSRRDGAFEISLSSADGNDPLNVAYTFGVDPLQQYLVQGADGGLQALPYAVDVRSGTGPQSQWFHLYPGETLAAGDALHWTGHLQNWNHMCADCHVTDFRKGYNEGTRQFLSTWSEPTVGCEACHGPASAHVATSGSTPLAALDGAQQVEVCGRCHARRATIAEGYAPGQALFDHYVPSLLDEGLYFADGQILDEVFVYGSFLQSRMHQRGVACDDCHKSHNAGVDISANATCVQCHQLKPPERFPTLTAGNYDDPDHHFHAPNTEGAQCVSCHMPSRTYMQVDERHDHSFRVPRPDLTDTIGVPNTCNTCHADRTPAWAAEEIRRRFPTKVPTHYGAAIAAARNGDFAAQSALTSIAADKNTHAPIVRATALSLLQSASSEAANAAITAGLEDPDPMVRLGALGGMRSVPAERRWWRLAPLLRDATLAVRLRTVELLTDAYPQLPESARQRLEPGLREYQQAQLLHADRPQALSNLASVLVNTGDAVGARRALDSALEIDPRWVPALLNLADLNRGEGQDGQSQVLFEQALEVVPKDADVRLAYALWLARAGRVEDAIAQLRVARANNPQHVRVGYTLAIALNSAGSEGEAITLLELLHTQNPANADILLALATMHRDRGDVVVAFGYAEKLVQLAPAQEEYAALLAQLRRAADAE